MKKGFVYILKCSDGSFYTGSTVDLNHRMEQHQNGHGANHTAKKLPIELVYFEEFLRIQDAFQRENPIIVELGVERGASTKIFLNAIANKPSASLISIDIEDCSSAASSEK